VWPGGLAGCGAACLVARGLPGARYSVLARRGRAVPRMRGRRLVSHHCHAPPLQRFGAHSDAEHLAWHCLEGSFHAAAPHIRGAFAKAYNWLLLLLLLAAGCWLLAAGCWLLPAACWLLPAGCWLLLLWRRAAAVAARRRRRLCAALPAGAGMYTTMVSRRAARYLAPPQPRPVPPRRQTSQPTSALTYMPLPSPGRARFICREVHLREGPDCCTTTCAHHVKVVKAPNSTA
jgi:hypothetical protein